MPKRPINGNGLTMADLLYGDRKQPVEKDLFSDMIQHRVYRKGVQVSSGATPEQIRAMLQPDEFPHLCYDNGYSCISYDEISWESLTKLDRPRNIYLMSKRTGPRQSEVSFS